MQGTTSLNEVLDAIERLPAEDQEDLLDVVRRRLAERGRQRIADDAAAGRAEHAAGQTQSMSVQEIMREIAP